MRRFVLYTKAERGSSCLRALLENSLRPMLCVAEDADPETIGLCSGAEVPHVIEKTPRSPAHISAVHAARPDLIVCAGYSKLLPADLFEPLALGAINCHGGKLPEYRGASPIPWQILRGETAGCAYILRMTRGVDDGPVLASETYSIEGEETARHVTDKVLAIFTRILPSVVQQYATGNPPAAHPQPEGEACHWTRRKPEDGLIDWSRLTSKQVVDLVRALDDPYPGAFVLHRGEKLVLRKARTFARRMGGVPGRFVGRSADGALVLALDGAVEILAFARGGAKLPGREFPAVYGDTFRAVAAG